MLRHQLFIVMVTVLVLGGGVCGGGMRPHTAQKLSKLTGEELIQGACKGLEDAKECISTLQTARPDQKADAHALSLFALAFVDKHGDNITDGIKKINAMPEVVPLVQSALGECLDQYNSVDDLIEDATQAIQTKIYGDAQRFIMASIDSLNLCDTSLKNSDFEEKAGKKTGPDYEMAIGLYKYNLLHKTLLLASLNMLKD